MLKTIAALSLLSASAGMPLTAPGVPAISANPPDLQMQEAVAERLADKFSHKGAEIPAAKLKPEPVLTHTEYAPVTPPANVSPAPQAPEPKQVKVPPVAAPQGTAQPEKPVTYSKPRFGWQYPEQVIKSVSRVEAYNFDPREVELTDVEKYAIDIAEENAKTRNCPPIYADGMIKYTFGMNAVHVTCAVLNVSDIELQAGESIQSISLGDTARWKVHTTLSGKDTPHIVIKPFDSNLQTSMVVTTDRRTYYINLASSKTRYMPRVGFIYPEEQQAIINAQVKKEKEERDRNTIPATNEYLGDLSFDYEISGKAWWKPARVYHNSTHTVLEMPDMSGREMPTLLMVRGKEQVLVNYRVQNDRYIVDAVLDKAILILGIGRNQEKVTITRRKHK